MKILVSGGTGFLGGHLVDRLREKEIPCVFLGRNAAAAREHALGSARFHQCSLEDASTLEGLDRDFTHIVHCAALSSPWGSRREFENANIKGTQNMIQVALRNPVARFVHISTPSIYVAATDREGVRESDPLPASSISEYARTKLEAEKLVLKGFKEQRLPAVMIRPQGIFGPRDRTILPRIIQRASRGVFPRIGNGQTKIDLTYVSNVVDSIELAMNAPERALGEAFNITNGDPRNTYELLRSVLARLDIRCREVPIAFPVAYAVGTVSEKFLGTFIPSREPALTRYTACILGKSRTLDISKAREILGYHPRVDLNEGVERFVHWWKSR